MRRPSSRAIASVGSSQVRMVWSGSSRCASSRMRFHASLADSCIGARERWEIFQGREMLRVGCGKVNPGLTREKRANEKEADGGAADDAEAVDTEAVDTEADDTEAAIASRSI